MSDKTLLDRLEMARSSFAANSCHYSNTEEAQARYRAHRDTLTEVIDLLTPPVCQDCGPLGFFWQHAFDCEKHQEPELSRLRSQVENLAADRVAADTEAAKLREEVETLKSTVAELNGYKSAVAEVHRRLDAACVESAAYTPCDDPSCYSQAGHRVKVLIARYDAQLLANELLVKQAKEMKEELTQALRGGAPGRRYQCHVCGLEGHEPGDPACDGPHGGFTDPDCPRCKDGTHSANGHEPTP